MDPKLTNSGHNSIGLFSLGCSCTDILSNRKNVKENLHLPHNSLLFLCCTTVNNAPQLCLHSRLLSQKIFQKNDMVKK